MLTYFVYLNAVAILIVARVAYAKIWGLDPMPFQKNKAKDLGCENRPLLLITTCRYLGTFVLFVVFSCLFYNLYEYYRLVKDESLDLPPRS